MEEFDGKKFNLFDTKYTIRIVDSIPTDKDNMFLFGSTDGIKKEIIIARKPENVEQSDKNMYLTLVHELVHAIFGEGCYHDANQDEPLVEWTAKCIISLIKQGILQDGSDYRNQSISNSYNQRTVG